jgi:phage antirepressor YoqD-like protein
MFQLKNGKKIPNYTPIKIGEMAYVLGMKQTDFRNYLKENDYLDHSSETKRLLKIAPEILLEKLKNKLDVPSKKSKDLRIITAKENVWNGITRGYTVLITYEGQNHFIKLFQKAE